MKPTSSRAIHPQGWPVEFAIEPADPRLPALIRTLTKLGYRPDITKTSCPDPAGSLPVCSLHDVAMPRREKDGDVWHSHTVTDADTGAVAYCRGYPAASAPDFSRQGGDPHES